MLKSPIASAKQFKRDENGGIAILFGLSAVAVAMFAGLAIDVGRTLASKEKIAAAIDAATLAAAKGMRLEGLNETQAEALARTVFAENVRNGAGNWTNIHDVRVTVSKAASTARVEVDASVKTTFGAIAGVQTMGSPGDASAVFESRDVEVAVQLDMTGSMCIPSCAKITALKTATTNLVDILLPDQPTGQKVRVGFAPFAAGVNAGPYVQAVNGNRAGLGKCVYERQSTANETKDVPPVGLDAFKVKSDLPPPPPKKSIQDCPKAELVPITDTKKTLKDMIKNFEASGSTAGQLGASWAWNLISDKWAGIWPTASTPAAFDDKTDKVVILMTDGNYNTLSGVNWNDSSPQAETARNISIDLCTGMKDLGVTVYTVGFMLDSADAEATLKSCAGKKGHPTPEDFFFKTNTGTELDDAFKSIASNIMKLRLTN